ncbi:DUF4136 domain-containing protein [Sphingomonas quercus]|uniref:DUF4136 domain-containing protein n=1 Tax=Sphingomonas quercus TaxID=2842451 RepID=A0ABS6BF05_9SPHN|nr:DUF4136 domain-containing protein [Sphingomonas quercus]MBU3076876.1 DUF4136 domain-containing protein [Sphingomonas quercus]
MTASVFRPKPAILLAALALSACATTGGGGGSLGPTQVTRFHLGQPIAPGDISIETRPGGLQAGPEFNVYASIVAGELTRLGFRQSEDLTKAEQVAVLDVARGTRESALPRQRSGVSLGLGGGTGGYRGGGVGLGGSVSFPVGKARSNDVTLTMLSVQIKRRSDGTVIWEGRAQGEARAGTPAADPDAAVRHLAAVLFQGFPGESGRTITVK